MIKKITLILFSIMVVLGSANAQKKNAYEDAIAEAVADKDFGTALFYYRVLVDEAEYDEIDMIFQAAETARKYRSYEFAEKWYARVTTDSLRSQEYPTAWFGLGTVRKSLGKYELAEEAFTRYLEINPDGIHADRANQDILDCDAALAADFDLQDSSIIHLDERVNTSYSELSALRVGEKLYYTSLRFDSKGEDPEYCCAFGRTLNSVDEAEGQLLGGNFNDTIWHTINGKFGPEEQTIYYNLCKNINASEVRCEIYSRAVDENGNWGAPERLNDRINLEGYTATQPTVGTNPKDGKIYLFFSSDRPEGKGGMDIWSSAMQYDGKFTDPINVGLFNTEGDDITPYFHGASGRLFFSSNGRSNLGGYDIYYSQLGDYDQWSEVKAMDYPVNTSYDEAFFSLSSGLDTPKGYFSSNRPGTFYKDTLYEYSCNDIFSFDIRIDLQVLTFNAVDSLTEWDSCTVVLKDLTAGEEKQVTNLYGHDFNFENLKAEHEYMIIGSREGYVTSKGYPADTLTFNTFGVFSSKKIVKKLYLMPKITLQVFTFSYDAIDTLPLAGCQVSLFDITTNSMILDSLIPLASNVDYNEYIYRYLLIGHRYRITAKKIGYTQAVTLVSLDGDLAEYLRPMTITRKLYLRCELCEFELLQIYFDNDEPGPHTRKALSSNEDYESTYTSYYSRRDIFIDQFPEGDPERDKLATFFDGNVKGGMVRLEQFAETLNRYIQEDGVFINVKIEGFASPLSNPAYNLSLTRRRVSAVELYLGEKYPDLETAINQGRINLKLNWYGEKEAKGGSESRKDTKRSIYNVEASKERRVEIKNFEIIRNGNKISSINK